MTWSIVAHDPTTHAFAVAVATKAFAVGASCPFVRTGIGAVSTQSFTNRYLAPATLDALARGLTPEWAIKSALTGDHGAGLRQIHAVDRHGQTYAHTGQHCVEACGSAAAPHVSVAGNMLTNQQVITATLQTYLNHPTLLLPERLLTAMDAGQTAGGDRRGRQSAALKLITAEDFPDLDLRVDDHPDPLAELRRLLEIWRSEGASRLTTAPTRANPSGLTDLDAIEANWKARGLDLRLHR
jgi:uncharacterized Ntn-hydrolase superfamily protein